MEGKNLSIYRLYAVYGSLLTDKQQEITEDYFGLDLSLGEIAEIKCISRQAVKDALASAEKQLLYYEQKLCFCDKTAKLNEFFSREQTDPVLKDKILNIMEGK